jgi:hydroxyacylglutathione hydrolase
LIISCHSLEFSFSRNALPTIPSTLADELECNIFLKAKDLESFSKLRDLKDNF